MKMLFFGLCLLITSMSAMLLADDTPPSHPCQKVIILLGPPGSGKGTQAARLTTTLNFPHISTGDLFRENISKNTELGQRAKEYTNAGKLVPDEVVLDMLFDRLKRPDCINGYLLDGFPRTIAQAEAFDKFLPATACVTVFNLDVPDNLIVERLAGRLTCKQCGNIQNRTFSPPAKEGICDKCGGQLEQRADDRAEVVLERLKTYHLQTKPLIDYYDKKGILTTIDATISPETTLQAILSKLKTNK